jgi:hypothetical protein
MGSKLRFLSGLQKWREIVCACVRVCVCVCVGRNPLKLSLLLRGVCLYLGRLGFIGKLLALCGVCQLSNTCQTGLFTGLVGWYGEGGEIVAV